jgi:hypothetical protein
MAVTAVAAVHAKAGKAKDRLVPRATAHPPPDAMAHKAHPALKVKGKAAAKAGVMACAKVAVAKSNVGIPVLTTALMAKAVQPHGVRVQKVAAVAVKGVKVAAKTVAVWMATNCLATSTP